MSVLLNIFNNCALALWILVIAALGSRYFSRWGELSLYRAFITVTCLVYLAVLACIKLSYLVLFINITLPIGVALLIWSLFTGRIHLNYLPILFFLIVVPLALRILFLAIETTDGRAIWLFQAKMIYFYGQFSRDSGLTEAAVAFSHLDYPKLVPCLGAVSLSLAGFWNEYVPKACLLVLLVGFVLGVARLRSFNPILRAFLILAIGPLNLFQLSLWNAMMDGWIALFALLGQAFLIDYLYGKDVESLKAGLMTILLPALIKNEGMVIAFLSLFVFALLYLTALKKSWHIEVSFRRCFSLGTLLVIVDFLVWTVHKSSWGLSSQYQINNLDWVKKVAERLNLHDIEAIYIQLIHLPQIDSLALLVIAALVLGLILNRKLKVAAGPELLFHIYLPMITACLYLGVLFVIYLSTPHLLSWHLVSSLPRVALPIMVLMVFALQGCCTLLLSRFTTQGEQMVCRLIELGSRCRIRN